MKFLVDTQLPRRLAQFLQNARYDTLHTRDLPDSNATPDTGAYNEIAIDLAPECVRFLCTHYSHHLNPSPAPQKTSTR